MEYQVKLTDYAIGQIQESVTYISKVLLVPDVAHRWATRIEEDISSLKRMPGRYPLTPEEPWHSEGIHKMPTGNFLVYYWIDDAKSIVWITAVVYGRRDQLHALRSMPNDKR